jgi:hypothetical protein
VWRPGSSKSKTYGDFFFFLRDLKQRACVSQSVPTMGDRGSIKVALTDSTTEWDEILINKGILSRDEVLRNKGVDPDEIRLKQAIVSIHLRCSNYSAQQ